MATDVCALDSFDSQCEHFFLHAVHVPRELCFTHACFSSAAMSVAIQYGMQINAYRCKGEVNESKALLVSCV
jgi:hypothetical protein